MTNFLRQHPPPPPPPDQPRTSTNLVDLARSFVEGRNRLQEIDEEVGKLKEQEVNVRAKLGEVVKALIDQAVSESYPLAAYVVDSEVVIIGQDIPGGIQLVRGNNPISSGGVQG